jgi:hypothetical protein
MVGAELEPSGKNRKTGSGAEIEKGNFLERIEKIAHDATTHRGNYDATIC